MRRATYVLALVAGSVVAAGDADAQIIRDYTDEANKTYGAGGDNGNGGTGGQIVIPGMPVPAQPQAGKGEDGGDGDKKGVSKGGSVTIFRGSEFNRTNKGPRVTLDLPQTKIYSGIIPGKRDAVSHLNTAKERGRDSRINRIIWVGFVPEQQRTRLFFLTARGAQYDWSPGKGSTIKVAFSGMRTSRKNFVRHIDSRFYDRAVTRIEARRRRNTVTYTIYLRNDAGQPTVSQDGNYIFFDFPRRAEALERERDALDNADTSKKSGSKGDS